MVESENGHPYPNPNVWLADYAKVLGQAKKQLLVLAANNDPFNVGTEAQIEQGKWFKGVHDQVGYSGIHLRRLHYRAYDAGVLNLDGEPYQNTEKQWEALQNASRFARYLGYVDPEDFTDNRSPNPMLSVSSELYAEWQEIPENEELAAQGDPEKYDLLTASHEDDIGKLMNESRTYMRTLTV